MLQLEGTSQFGGGNGEQPRVGGAGPSSGGSSGFFSGSGQGARFLTHQQAREQIMGIQPQATGATTMGAPTNGVQYPGSSSLVQGLQGRAQGLQGDIRGAGESFRNQVGQADPYDESALLGAIDPTRSVDQRAPQTDAAKRQLDTSYGGPTALAPEVVANIAGKLNDYEQEARSLQTGGGLSDAMRRRTPGMNQGMAQFEAERTLRENPNYRDTFVPEVQRAASLKADLANESARAMEAANLRQVQEKQIGEKARGFLDTQKSDVFARLQAEVDAKNKEQEAAKAAYDQAVADPTQANLNAMDPYTDADLARFAEPGALPAEAKAAYADIMRRYAEAFPEIAAYPPLQKIITRRGEKYYGIPNADGTVTDIRKIKGMTQNTQKHLMARQKELEERFEPQREKTKSKTPEGKYANVAPLYYGDQGSDPLENVYQPPDPKDYLSLDEGNTATMEMLASSNDRTLVDNVNSLIGESDRLMETGETFRAAMIAADVEKYLSDAEAQMRERTGELDEKDRLFDKAVKKARHRYRKAKAKELGSTIGAAVGGVLTYYLGGPYSPIGQYVGGPLGAEIGEGVA